MNNYCCEHSPDPNGEHVKFSSKVVTVFGSSANYDDLKNKPSINGVVLQGNKTDLELQFLPITNEEIEQLFKKGEIQND